MVQVRWDHLNRDASLLTKSQAIFLDGHFVIEHTARNRSGRFMHFNGTAGIWRRSTIDDAGGWEHDTLTEDLDLSYRPDEGVAVRLPPAGLCTGGTASRDDQLQATGRIAGPRGRPKPLASCSTVFCSRATCHIESNLRRSSI